MHALTASLPTAALQTPMDWFLAVLQIVAIDIVLAGDNAVVIALAVRRLEKKERLWGIGIGSGMAVILRIGLTYVASQLLAISYIKLVGGVLILWIAVKLLLENSADENGKGKAEASNLWQAVWLITVADITMSLDNVMAVAGAAKNNTALMVFGLVLSIPLVVFTSNLLAKLMDRYKAIIYIGAAILGHVGGSMIMSDQVIVSTFHPEPWLTHSVEVLMMLGVVLVALALRARTRKSAAD